MNILHHSKFLLVTAIPLKSQGAPCENNLSLHHCSNMPKFIYKPLSMLFTLMHIPSASKLL